MEQNLKFIQYGDNINLIAKLCGVNKDKQKNYFIYISGIMEPTKSVCVKVNLKDYKEAKKICGYMAFKSINIGGWTTMINGRNGIKANKVNLNTQGAYLADWYRMIIPQFKFWGQNIISIPAKYEKRWSQCSYEYKKQFVMKWDMFLKKMEMLIS